LKQFRQIKFVFGSRAGIVTTVSSLVLLALLTALPFAAKHAALSWLMKNGMEEACIDNVDINLFAGTLAVEGVHLRAKNGETSDLHRFYVNLAMAELVKKRVRIASLQLEGLDLTVHLGETLSLGGIALPTGAPDPEPPIQTEKKPKKPWHIGIDTLTIKDTSVALALPKLDLDLALYDVSLTRLHAWNPGEEARLEVKGSLNKSPLLISLDLAPFAKDTSVQGGIQLNAFALAPFNQLAAPHITGFQGELTIDTRMTITHTPGIGTTLSQTGTLSLNNLGGHLKEPGVALTNLDLTWLGDVWVALDTAGDITDLRSLGCLANSELDAIYTPMGLRVHHEGMVWNGELSLQPGLEDGLAARGNLSVKQALVMDTESGVKLAALSYLFAYDMQAKGLDNIRVPHISIKGLNTLPPLSEIGTVDVTGVAIDDLSHLRADTFIVSDVVTALERDPSGQFTFFKKVDSLAAFKGSKAKPSLSETKPPIATEPPLTVKINTFRISGDHFLSLTDRSVTPVFKKGINLKRLELLGIDSSNPEKDLPLTLEAELDTYETLSVTGTIRPFALEVTAHLDARIANINLAHLSPYSSQALGYLIETGSFTADSTLNIDAGMLDVTNQFTLRNLELVADDEKTIDQVIKNLTMPLDYALSILEDNNGTINLTIPVRGDIHNPDINLNSIIQIATAKAITTASVSYLSFLLQPYGALLMVAEKAGQMVTEIHLDPVGYELGAIQPNPAGLDYLKVVAGLMKKKEFLNLTVCANAVADDLSIEKKSAGEKIEEEAAPLVQNESPSPAPVDKAIYLDLARQRSKAIRDILATEGIAPGRIHLCHPNFTVSEQKKPKAVLML